MALPPYTSVLAEAVRDFVTTPPAIATEMPPSVVVTRNQTLENVPEVPTLFGLSPRVYRNLNALLKAGKRHLIFFGPPGTGKTTLAEHVAAYLSTNEEYEFITGSSNITADYLIGGYQPIGDGKVEFRAGVILRNGNSPVIIDELNRCDIDSALGPLFSVLNDSSTTLPMLAVPSDEQSAFVKVELGAESDAKLGIYGLGDDWRLIATMNTIDRVQLNQLSYALSRRFGWVYVEEPTDLPGFIRHFAGINGLPVPAEVQSCPLAVIWAAVNTVRPLGGAPFKDLIALVKASITDADLFAAPEPELAEVLAEGIVSLVAPLLGGIAFEQVEAIVHAISSEVRLPETHSAIQVLIRVLREGAI
ncbi:AAA family ATPase [Paraburkholderia sp. C35]|uniref:AAA family ATPase n=1 Tax=Paraburkholderia sp. C35 TaxID=2126993 RepID=UPI000D69B055|nr:AAA family ATPase [Paraburkholderia sp. C35]